MTVCEIEWNGLSLARWDELFGTVRRSTLLQHLPYAQAVRARQQIGARHGLIHLDGAPAGLVQIGEVGVLRNAIHAVTLDRGPLWFDEASAETGTVAFFKEFARQFPRRLGRKIRVMPELALTEGNRRAMADTGLVANERYRGYQTIWVDLSADEDRLRARLAGKWRNILSKAERSGLATEEDWDLATAAQLIDGHEKDKQEKGYGGPSRAFVQSLLSFTGRRREALILNALQDEETVASILVLVHGTSATYQIGWTTDAGRRTGAHHLLLWQAMLALKRDGVLDLDLGGVNDEGAAGIKKFKMGLGGSLVDLLGMYH